MAMSENNIFVYEGVVEIEVDECFSLIRLEGEWPPYLAERLVAVFGPPGASEQQLKDPDENHPHRWGPWSGSLGRFKIVIERSDGEGMD